MIKSKPDKQRERAEFLNREEHDSVADGFYDEPSEKSEAQVVFSQKQFTLTLPPRFKKLIERAMKGSASPRQAIRAKCFDCVGFEDASRRIDACSTSICPLHKYRPRSEKARRTDGEVNVEKK